MKKIYIERQGNLIKVAIKEGQILKECFVDEELEKPRVGEIYKGIVKNIVPAMHCAFVDIGYEKNAYMPLDGKLKDSVAKRGDEVLVEITKEEVGKKGPKVSRNISIPGAYVVVTNETKGIEISRKIQNAEFREKISKKLEKNDDIGLVIRTKAEEVSFETIKAEAEELFKEYEKIHSKFIYELKVGSLYKDKGILSRVLRNNITSEVEIIVDNIKDYEFYKEQVEEKGLVNVKLTHYKEELALFDNYEVERDILALRHSKINLPSGGNIVIEKTEAMHVVDVNTAKTMKSSATPESVYLTNLEAAKEIVRQIRLRNLGGIILVDFIDMKFKDEKAKIINTLNEEFRTDKNNPKVFPFTELNLVQISRKKYGKSIVDYLLKECHHCGGGGKNLDLNYLIPILRGKINRIKKEQCVKNICIEINDIYEQEIRGDVFGFATKLDALDCDLYIDFEKNLENFKVEPIIFHSQIENLQSLQVFSGKERTL